MRWPERQAGGNPCQERPHDMREDTTMEITSDTGQLLGMTRLVGLPVKGAYTISEIAAASGVSPTTLRREASRGRLRTFLPPGRERGQLVKPEWFDEWFEEGVR